MEVAIAYAEDIGFYIIDCLGTPVCANIFSDWDSALVFCDNVGYTLVDE